MTLCFPATDDTDTENVSPQQRQGPIGGTERILVVEDDTLVRQNLVVQLRRPGYAIVAAGSAAEALQIMGQSPPFDLLFTDVVMPGVCRKGVNRMLPDHRRGAPVSQLRRS